MSKQIDFCEPDKLKQLAKDVIKDAKALGASDVEVSISQSVGLNTTARLGKVDVLEYNRDKGIGITVYHGKKTGYVSTNDISNEAITTAINKANAIAKYTSEDICNGLAEKELLATEIKDLDLHHPWDIDAAGAIDLAIACESAAFRSNKQITNSDGASVHTSQSYRVYANSNDFCQGFLSSSHSVYCVVLSEHNNEKERDYEYTIARDAKRLVDIKQIGELAAKKTVARLDAKKIKTTKLPVIFNANVAKGIFGHFLGAIAGSNLYKKTSFLLDKKGSEIFNRKINIIEDPFILQGFGSTPYDAQGVKVNKRSLVEDGVLQGYMLSSYSARKLKMQTTGNAGGAHNIIVKPDDLSKDSLIKTMDKGIIISEVMGQGVNLVTGDYSRGAFGFYVENGEIQYPVTEFTIAGNLQDMFKDIVAISNDLDLRSNIHTGSILIDNMTIAGA